MRILLGAFFLFVALTVKANVYYVAIDGNDVNSGKTLAEPFKTISKAAGIAEAGDVIFVRGGTYLMLSTVSLTKNGNEDSPITLQGYENERALLDFSVIPFGKRGIELKGNYWNIKGVDICKAGDNGMFISGAYNNIEYCSFYDNKDTGLQLGGGAHDNKIINCDSYWNADPTDYGDADGFACKLDVGTNNYFYGCRAWLNVDDGWDGYMRGNDDVSTVLENCWTWMNGYFKDGSDGGPSANGNGFKMGGSDDRNLSHNFTLRNCVAFNNKAKGFDQNNNMGSMILENCSGFGNKGDNYKISRTLALGKSCRVTNCLSYNGKVSLGSFVEQITNSWMIPFIVSDDDFISIDTTGMSSKRGEDGSLPYVDFLRLSNTSDLIDAGTNIGLDYLGSAPDLGAFEFAPSTEASLMADNSFKVYFSGDDLIFVFNRPINNPKNFRMYNSNGQLVLNTEIYSESVLNCSGLLRGMYIVEVNSGKERFVNKVIK